MGTGTDIVGVGSILSSVGADIGEGINAGITTGWPYAAGVLAFFIGWKIFKRVTKGV